ncbi:MAG TPA: hypothetical protein VN901_19320 [Candidatus Acidoferrales bacterium]|nr:hypothetical protein [Candidatus Acidoferrales bacterium]
MPAFSGSVTIGAVEDGVVPGDTTDSEDTCAYARQTTIDPVRKLATKPFDQKRPMGIPVRYISTRQLDADFRP